MDTIIQKAAKGSRSALTELYEANAVTLYFLSKALLRNGAQTAPATTWALRTAFQAAEKGELRTAEDFSVFAVRQAALYCKREVAKTDPRAFKMPPKKDFRITSAKEHAIDRSAGGVENYILCLPAIQRFTLVLRLVGGMTDLQIARVIGLDTDTVARIREAESDNLAKIYRAVKDAGGQCCASTGEMIRTGFAEALAATVLPEAVTDPMTRYIDSIAAPMEAAAKSKGKKLCMIGAAVLVCVVILIAVFRGSSYTYTTGSSGDYFETSGSDETTGSTSDTAADSSDTLDPSLIYYADMVIEDYGTITVQLDQEVAPITAANFVNLAESGFYDGLTFHRIYAGFMIQGGDPNGDGTGGSDEEIVGEFASNGYENDLSHTRGVISMARSSDYDSASSQFFIVHEDSDFLDGEYAAFGWVIEGMDIVDAICEDAEPYDSNGMIYAADQPVITSITIRTEEAEQEAAAATGEAE